MRQFSLQSYQPNDSGFSGLHAGRYGLRRNSGRVYRLSPAGKNEREADRSIVLYGFDFDFTPLRL